MAVPVIASTSTFNESSNTTSRSINKPTGTTSGDWLIAIISMDGTGTITLTGSTFTELYQVTGVTNSFAAFARKADGTEGASFTVGSAREQGTGVMMRVTGGDSTNIVDVISLFHGFAGVNSEIEAPIAYAESDDSLIIHACGADNGITSLTKPSGDTAIVTNTGFSGTGAAQLTVSSVSQASAGHTAHAHFDISLTTEEAICFTIVLRSTTTPATYPSQPYIRNVALRAPRNTEVLNIQKPYGVVDGDFLIACAVSDVTSTLTPDGSFTSIQDTSNSQVWSQMYRRVAASEPSEYTWSNSTTSTKIAGILNIKNVDTASSIDTSTVDTASTASMDAPTLTPSGDNRLLIYYGGADDDDVTYNAGYPSGYTNILTLGSTLGNDVTFMLAFLAQTTAAATGTVSGTLDVSEEWIAMLAAGVPAAAGGGFQAAWARGSNTLLHIGNN